MMPVTSYAGPGPAATAPGTSIKGRSEYATDCQRVGSVTSGMPTVGRRRYALGAGPVVPVGEQLYRVSNVNPNGAVDAHGLDVPLTTTSNVDKNVCKNAFFDQIKNYSHCYHVFFFFLICGKKLYMQGAYASNAICIKNIYIYI